MSLRSIEKIGIVGGGINAALLCLEARKKGIQTTIVDPHMYCAASKIADEHLVSPLGKDILHKLIQRTDFIVFMTKLEDVDDYSLLLKEKANVYPSIEVLEALSSRRRFLEEMEQLELPTVRYKILEDEAEVLELLKDIELPISITKHYENKFQEKQSDQTLLFSDEDIVDLLIGKNKKVDYWLVEEMHLEPIELSIGVTRDVKSKMYTYGVSEDVYDGDNWVQSYVPARTTKTLQREATALARRTVRRLDGTGTFTVRIVVGEDKELYVRDVQPYPLENAVYTKENCSISQYDHLIRTILGLPLYPATSNTGVIFSYLERQASPEDVEAMNKILEKPGTNMHSFKGKTSRDTKLLYTFKADNWDDLEET